MKLSLLLLPLGFAISAWSQEATIELENPSFEGIATEGTTNGALPRGWYDCGFPGETVPDVHPKIGGGAFQVTKEPFHGETYLGMVVRENDTWELVSQRLASTLKAGKCYDFSIYLARSELYVSMSRVSNTMKNYGTPVRLRVWGGNGYCSKLELLAESPDITNYRWLKYDLQFKPKKSHTHLVLEAYYVTPSPFAYNGNLLLDNASAITLAPCPELVAAKSPDKPEVKKNTPTKPKPTQPKPTPAPPKKQRLLVDLEKSKLEKGQIIQMKQVQFPGESAKLEDSSFAVLDEVYEFLVENPDVIIEIGGHTNSLPPELECDRLSTARAKSVMEYLNKKGIPSRQLQFQGYGKRRPVAPNTTEDGRKKNQRVEIKIVSFQSK